MAHTFRDLSNNWWTITITIDAAKRVRNALGLDLLSYIDRPSELQALAADPIALVDLLFVLIKPEADALGITDEDFGRALDGDTIDAATNAFLEALIDFFPAARRAIFRKILDRATKATDATHQQLHTMIQTGEIDRLIDKALTDGATSGGSPAPSASTPAPSPSPNSSPSPNPTAATPGTTPPQSSPS